MTVKVETTTDTRFGTNSYLVEDEETHDAAVIDANLEPDHMIEVVRERGANVKAILLTHTDLDHIAGIHELREAFGEVPVAVHESERFVLDEGKPLRREFGPVATRIDGVATFGDGDTYRAGSLEFEVLHTPGHSPGGVSLKIGDHVFTGDALFAGSIGRSDFHNSDSGALLDGIKAKLMTLPDGVHVHSGHGPATTIGRERTTNPFL
jgi:glyoxylase-like metal-dependent hydrolase (beta-lactamase superfamily II)